MPKKSAKRYKTFTGYPGEEPPKVTRKKTPKEWVAIAKPLFIAYNSSKINGGGDGTLQGFKHRFGAQIQLYTNPEGTMLLIAGPGLKVTSRGIVG